MIVPKYWSESKTKKVINGKQFTLKRFGWSDISEADAKKHADSRLQEAVTVLERDGDVRRIDHKTSYNGAEGVPIREEVISKHQDIVISRNSYGALCLNTPDVLFADIDFEYEAPLKTSVSVFILLLSCAALISWFFKVSALFIIGLFVSIILASTVANLAHRIVLSLKGGVEKKALSRIKKISKENPELNLRIYRTPLGLRILLMNDTYCPTDDNVIRLLKDFQSDTIYIQMCKNQNCFRARVSPKPWRIGVERLKPRPGVWPIKEERMTERRKWVANYEKKARSYCSCHYLMQMGSNKVDSRAELVRSIHDDFCRVNKKEFKIA